MKEDNKDVQHGEETRHYNNSITIADFQVASDTESMDKLVLVMKDLIGHYSDFASSRVQHHVLRNVGGVGIG